MVQEGSLNSAVTLAKPTPQLARGYLICLLGTAIWSTTAIFIRYITLNFSMPPLLLAFWRDLFVCLTLGVVLIILNRPLLRVGRRNLVFLTGYGLALMLLNTSWTISVAYNGAAVSTVLGYSSPAFTALIAWRLFGERLGKVKIAVVILAILGCALVSKAYTPEVWQLNGIGLIAGLFSGVTFGIYILMGKAASLRKINPLSTLLYTFSIAAILLLVVNLTSLGQAMGLAHSNLFWLGGKYPAWIALVFLAIGPTIGGFGLYTVSLGYLPASVANLIATLEPVFTAILAYLILAERLDRIQLLGSGLIVAGVILLRLYEGRE
jgi:drug/metabolite transporter (DMT)-like permease